MLEMEGIFEVQIYAALVTQIPFTNNPYDRTGVTLSTHYNKNLLKG